MTALSQRGNIFDELARLGALAYVALPDRIHRLLAGPPVKVDGQTLDPQVQLALRFMNIVPESYDFTHLPLPALRTLVDKSAIVLGPRAEVARVYNINIPTRAGSVPGRVYANFGPDEEPVGTLVYMHGGGWVLGSLDTADGICRVIASRGPVRVLSVAYRLAPEFVYPSAGQDCIDAYTYARKEWPGAPVAVGGDSSGGHLSFIVAQRADPKPDYVLALYPATDTADEHDKDSTRRSVQLFGQGYLLNQSTIDMFRKHYGIRDMPAEHASPLEGNMEGHPPTHIAVAGFDPLRDEGLEYAAKLKAAGVQVSSQVVAGQIHSFGNYAGVSREAIEALEACADKVLQGLRKAKECNTGPNGL